MTITIEEEMEAPFDFDWKSLVEQAVLACLDYEKCAYEAEVSVLLTDGESVHEINRQFRGVDSTTDVLSFPMISYEKPGDFSHVEDAGQDCFNPESGELVLGDIVLSADRVLEQAEQYGHSNQRELAFLTVHSMFHLFGYDHMEDAEREVMEKRQREVMDILGISR